MVGCISFLALERCAIGIVRCPSFNISMIALIDPVEPKSRVKSVVYKLEAVVLKLQYKKHYCLKYYVFLKTSNISINS